MKVKIISARKGTFWYVNQIGSTFTVKISEKHPADYVLDENTLHSTLLILKSDCEVIEEEAAQPEPFDLERAKKGDKFTWNDNPGTYCIIGKSPNGYQSEHGCKYVVEQVDWKGDIYLWRWTADELSKFTMAPKEPEYFDGYVIVDKHGIAPCVYPDVKSASHSAVFNNADRKFRIEKIRFPKP